MSVEEIIRDALERLRLEHGLVVTKIEAQWANVSTIAKRDHVLSILTVEADLQKPAEKP